jgi:hypothetical protein
MDKARRIAELANAGQCGLFRQLDRFRIILADLLSYPLSSIPSPFCPGACTAWVEFLPQNKTRIRRTFGWPVVPRVQLAAQPFASLMFASWMMNNSG